MYTFAKLGAALVPIAAPLTCMKFSSLKVKLFSLRTFGRRQVNVLAEGWLGPFFQVPP